MDEILVFLEMDFSELLQLPAEEKYKIIKTEVLYGRLNIENAIDLIPIEDRKKEPFIELNEALKHIREVEKLLKYNL